MPSTRRLRRPFSFPWGAGQIVEEVSIETDYHSPTVQLLEYDDGTFSVRFCAYSLSGRFLRSPMMASAQDLKDLARELTKAPRLAKFVGALIP